MNKKLDSLLMYNFNNRPQQLFRSQMRVRENSAQGGFQERDEFCRSFMMRST